MMLKKFKTGMSQLIVRSYKNNSVIDLDGFLGTCNNDTIRTRARTDVFVYNGAYATTFCRPCLLEHQRNTSTAIVYVCASMLYVTRDVSLSSCAERRRRDGDTVGGAAGRWGFVRSTDRPTDHPLASLPRTTTGPPAVRSARSFCRTVCLKRSPVTFVETSDVTKLLSLLFRARLERPDHPPLRRDVWELAAFPARTNLNDPHCETDDNYVIKTDVDKST